jgi:hypothetical protein
MISLRHVVLILVMVVTFNLILSSFANSSEAVPAGKLDQKAELTRVLPASSSSASRS